VKNVRQFIVERYGFPTSRDSMVREKTDVYRESESARSTGLRLSFFFAFGVSSDARSSSLTRDTRTLLIGPPKRTSFVG
jgi:hypothetical protein